MTLVMGILSNNSEIAHALAFLFEDNFLTYVFSDEEELFLWLDQAGDEVDTLIVDCSGESDYDGYDLVATIADESDGWPKIRTILMGDEDASYENKTSIWQASLNSDYLGTPHAVEELVAIVSGQLTRVSE